MTLNASGLQYILNLSLNPNVSPKIN